MCKRPVDLGPYLLLLRRTIPSCFSVYRDKKFEPAICVLCQQRRQIRILDRIDCPSAAVNSALLELCIQQWALGVGERVHGHARTSGLILGSPFLSNRIIHLYLKCGRLGDARKVFDEMEHRDPCSWNTLILGYMQVGRLTEARNLFDEMPQRDLYSWNTLIFGYTQAGRLAEARNLFYKMPQRDKFSWTAVISGFVRHAKPGDALELYRAMQKDTHSRCSGFSVSSALAASADIQSLHSGKDIHGHIMRMGLNSDAFVWSALSYMYGKCGTLEAARHIFDCTLDRDVVSWNVMITRYLSDGRTEEGVALFWELLGSGIRPTDFTFTQVLNACADNAAEGLGREVHGYMVRNGCVPSEFSASALVHMYSKCGDVEKARRVFNQMPQRDLVSFTSLITGYAQNGQSHEALQLFELLLKSGTHPDDISFVCVLSACAHAGLVEKGLQYFYSINEKHGLMHTAHHYSCIIDLLS